MKTLFNVIVVSLIEFYSFCDFFIFWGHFIWFVLGQAESNNNINIVIYTIHNIYIYIYNIQPYIHSEEETRKHQTNHIDTFK